MKQQEYLRLSLQVTDNPKENIKMRQDSDNLTEDMKGVLIRGPASYYNLRGNSGTISLHSVSVLMRIIAYLIAG